MFSSIFAAAATPANESEEDSVIQAEVTIRARPSIDCDTPAAVSSISRLSTLFVDWMVPTGLEDHSSVKGKVGAPSELVGEVPKRFGTISGSIRGTGLVGLGIEDKEGTDIDMQLESLMVSTYPRPEFVGATDDKLTPAERSWDEGRTEGSNDEDEH